MRGLTSAAPRRRSSSSRRRRTDVPPGRRCRRPRSRTTRIGGGGLRRSWMRGARDARKGLPHSGCLRAWRRSIPHLYSTPSVLSPMLRADRIQEREYQVKLAEEAGRQNSLLVLPTGLGKTVVACYVIAAKLTATDGRALILAPSRPLADQHRASLDEFLDAGPVAL